jgi:hypothetical protein
MKHDPENRSCPLNDPETFLNPATSGMDCECDVKAIQGYNEWQELAYKIARDSSDGLMHYLRAKYPVFAVRVDRGGDPEHGGVKVKIVFEVESEKGLDKLFERVASDLRENVFTGELFHSVTIQARRSWGYSFETGKSRR